MVYKSTHSINSSTSKKKDAKYSTTMKGVNYHAQIRNLLEEEALRAPKRASGYLHKGAPLEGQLHHRMSAQSPSYKFKEYQSKIEK